MNDSVWSLVWWWRRTNQLSLDRLRQEDEGLGQPALHSECLTQNNKDLKFRQAKY